MDALGDEPEIPEDGELVPARAPLLTPEAKALTATGLVLCSLLGTELFQFLSFLIGDSEGGVSQASRYALFAGPGGALAAGGAVLGWQSRTASTHDLVRALSVAALIIGSLIALATGAGLVVAYTANPF